VPGFQPALNIPATVPGAGKLEADPHSPGCLDDASRIRAAVLMLCQPAGEVVAQADVMLGLVAVVAQGGGEVE
jgi:hypothetical protein